MTLALERSQLAVSAQMAQCPCLASPEHFLWLHESDINNLENALPPFSLFSFINISSSISPNLASNLQYPAFAPQVLSAAKIAGLYHPTWHIMHFKANQADLITIDRQVG